MSINIGLPFGSRREVDDAIMEWQRLHDMSGYMSVTGTAPDGRDVLMNMPDGLVAFLRSKGINVTIER